MNRAILLLTVCLTGAAFAQDNPAPDKPKTEKPKTRASRALDFPPGVFVDGRKYSIADAEGKLVVFWFFEREDPRVNTSVPEINQLAEKFRDKPVLFFAIAAGDTLPDARAFVRATGLKMPVFVDNLSLMERRYAVRISKNNPAEFRMVTAAGTSAGRLLTLTDLENAFDKHLDDAKWKYKDQNYDSRLHPAIDLIEAGLYADGLKLIKPFRTFANKSVAEAANRLYDAVRDEGKKWILQAEEATKDRPAEAYEIYGRTALAFTGEDLAKKAQEAQRKLLTAPAVKDELTARQMWDRLSAAILQANLKQKDEIMEYAAEIARRYSKTPTGEKAAELTKELMGG